MHISKVLWKILRQLLFEKQNTRPTNHLHCLDLRSKCTKVVHAFSRDLPHEDDNLASGLLGKLRCDKRAAAVMGVWRKEVGDTAVTAAAERTQIRNVGDDELGSEVLRGRAELRLSSTMQQAIMQDVQCSPAC